MTEHVELEGHATRFVSEALDSKNVTLDDYRKPESEHHFLRLRLNVVARILLGHTMIVPQGWSIDSLPFFRIIGEFSAALKVVEKDSRLAGKIETFSPFVRESHIGELTYRELLRVYLGRNDCHWSGLPILQDAERRTYLSHRLLTLPQGRNGPDADAFRVAARECLDGAGSREIVFEVSEAWRAAFEYFSSLETGLGLGGPSASRGKDPRLAAAFMAKNAYRDNVQAAIDKTSLLIRDIDDDLFQDISNFSHRLRNEQPPEATSVATSTVLNLAGGGLVKTEAAKIAIRHISTFAQIRAAAVSTKADASAPAVPFEAHPGLRVAESLIQHAFGRPGSASGVSLRAELDLVLEERLARTNWHDLWCNAISLSFDETWRSLVETVNKSASDKTNPLDLRSFHRLETMLAENCPQLTLTRTGIERLGFRLEAATLAKAAKTFNPAAAAGLAGPALDTLKAAGAHALPDIILDFATQHLFATSSISALATAVAGATVSKTLNPFDPQSALANTATIFQLDA